MSHILSPSLSVTEDLWKNYRAFVGGFKQKPPMWGWSNRQFGRQNLRRRMMCLSNTLPRTVPGKISCQDRVLGKKNEIQRNFCSFLLMRFRGCDAIQKLWRITSWDSLKQNENATYEWIQQKLFIGEDAPLPSTSPHYHIFFIILFVRDPELPEYLSLLLAGVAHPNKYLYSLNICLYKYTYFYI